MAPAFTSASAAFVPAISRAKMDNGDGRHRGERAMTKVTLWLGAILLGSLTVLPVAAQQGPIKIGEINSYSGMAAFTAPYKNGLLLAEEEINAAGGVLGRKIEIVTRDDGLKPEDAVRAANELLTSEKVALLAGG